MKDTLFILLQHLLPQHLLSRAVGYLADSRCNWIKRPFIKTFAKRYRVNMAEALIEDLDQYDHFNAFFTRALKADARPLDDAAVVSPADGEISQIGRIDYGRIVQAKGRGYGLSTLLGGHADLAEQFIHGCFTTIYLSPSDYHRVHMPVTGTLRESIYVPGDLYSVNQTTAKGVDNLFARNERLIAIFDTELGPMAMILVGAMIVAGIETVWGGQVAPVPKNSWRIDHQQPVEPVILQQGQEMGRFKLGSTVILLFGKEAIEWTDSLKADDPVRLGQQMSA
ncbi:archaetidylserine decarboxylase [Amphritea sp. 1_MG-2023]|uniref:archaetidylserine decarboxylase n=1 Tax=Amphritea sp. 1_MG-2023 TaxID=3062670 RepID=UPI0026E15B0E|nr:archaetidylserine decarboxylase [Amphritea sp. 1_MG-2023]MDO6564837.1 archaetidylserine decarboxylase [Amphritea sp. 1_MG-2023]